MGNTTNAWGSSVIIVFFVLSGVLLSAFIYTQFLLGDKATVPIRVVKQCSIVSGIYFSFLCSGSMIVIVYVFPFWFQAIKGVDAVQSGLDFLPPVISLFIASIAARRITEKTAYYTGTLIACSAIMSVEADLLTTLQMTPPLLDESASRYSTELASA